MRLKKHRLKYTPVNTYSKEIFRRSPHASWSVRLYTPRAGLDEAYACHNRCNSERGNNTKEKWSWFIDDSFEKGLPLQPAKCYGCYTPVPEYIQALVRLHEYDR